MPLKNFPVFCTKVHVAFMNTGNLDIVRIFYAIILVIVIFSKDESTDYDKSGTIITLAAILFQTICAYFSIYKALRTNNLRLHRLYLYSKFPYLLANIYERIVVHILSCQLENKISTLCDPTNKFIGVLIGFIAWNVFEAYLILIVYCFCKKVKNGDYGPAGARPLFPGEEDEALLRSLVNSLVKEARGVQVEEDELEDEEVELAFCADEYVKAKVFNSKENMTNENEILLEERDLTRRRGNINGNFKFVDLTEYYI